MGYWTASVSLVTMCLGVAISRSMLFCTAAPGIGSKLLAGAYYSQTIDIWAALFAGSVVAALLVTIVGIVGSIVERSMGGRPS